MPLSPPVTPADVEAIGALTPALFDFVDQPTLDTFIQGCIDFADAWMQGHLGPVNYGLHQFAWQVNLQRRGQIYLSLEAATDTLKSKRTYGSHVNYISEDSDAYRDLVETDWQARASKALDLWVTVEETLHPFALPIFSTSSPIPTIDSDGNGLAPLSVLYEEALAYSRGRTNPDVGTASR